ncbi:MAG: glycine/D-amino acid oxidase-like deaminating enzyme [Paraglaciecola sp.]|jgi:glycine/D-amino acid oxidase-like deaminating enzyme
MLTKQKYQPERVIIIGAGVVGAATALALQKSGHKVTLIDRDAPCSGASFGNAGAIVNGSCAPTAMPGIVYDAMVMLSQKAPALAIRPAYFHKILPWLVRFIWQSRASAVANNSRHLFALSNLAVQSWRQLTDNTELSKLLHQQGWLKVYQSSKSFDGSLNARQLLDRQGTKYQVLDRGDIQALEPNLAPIFNHGIFQQDSLHITNPDQLVQGMVDLMVKRGGNYKQFAVDNIAHQQQTVQLSGPEGILTADKVVIASGAWSKSLAKQLGDDIPLDTERGYHMMLANSTEALLQRPVVNVDNSFVLSPMEMGLRMTSQIEFGGLHLPPDYTRVRSLLPQVKRMLPKADLKEQSVWMGFRPSLPDSLPVLGYSSATNRVIYAFGHQHLGMTLGAVTALIIDDLLSNNTPRVELEPYRAKRFGLF